MCDIPVSTDGEMDIAGFNEANVPVDIWLDQDSETGAWELAIGNYMPRKGDVSESVVRLRCDSPEPLRALVRKYIVPFYETALRVVNGIANGDQKCLYYWEWKDAAPAPPAEDKEEE